MSSEFNMPAALSRLRIELFSSYLRARGWQQKQSEYTNRIYFEGAVHEGGEPYKLYLPASPGVPRFRTLLQRAVYFLCEVEDREPSQILPDILAQRSAPASASGATSSASGAAAPAGPARRIRVRNSADTPLQLIMKARSGEHQLMPGEFIELLCASDVVEIEQTATSLIVNDRCT